MLSTGDNFLRYNIISLIGRGGMGEVYLARDLQLDRKVAVKILRPKSHRLGDALERFILEAKSASALNHPNIITIYEIGEADGSNYITSEYIDGATLHERIGQRSLSLSEILRISIQTAEALTAAHAAGIVHRDIKPENIMIRDDGYVKVVDFGLAKLTEHEMELSEIEADTRRMVATNPGVIMGTASYMSPEQARGLAVDKRTDIWSLGVVIYEMLTGRRPFTGETTSDIIAAILKTEPEPIADVPSELARVLHKALRKDREERYQHIKDLLIDLKDLQREIDTQMRSETAILVSSNGEKSARPTGDGNLSARSTSPTRQRTNSISEIFLTQFRLHPISVTVIVLAALTALSVAGFAIKGVLIRTNSTQAFNSMRFTKLTASGQAIEGMIAISSDGKYVAYAAREEGRQGLWVGQSTTPGKTQVVPSGDMSFNGLTFTHDDRYVYFTATDEKGRSSVYRVSALGGDNRKVISDAYGPVSFSQDDSQFGFIRDHRELLIANSDGSNPRSIATGEPGDAWEAPTWSPDGKKIAVRSYSASDSLMRLVIVSVADGAKVPLGTFAWPMISSLVWLPDGSGILISGRDPETLYSQLWTVAYPAGELSRITNEPNSYVGAAITSDGRTAVSVQVNRNSQFSTVDAGDPKNLKRLPLELGKDAGLSGLSLAPDGKIAYTTRATAYQDIWVADPANGSNRQLTSNAGSNFYPNVSPDGKYIVFVSNRTGNANLWKMEIDGNNTVQLTDSPGIEGYLSISPDGKWIVYQVADDQRRLSIWKMSTDGGEPVQLISDSSSRPQVSPDGKRIACKYGQSSSGGNGKIAVLSLDGSSELQLFDLPDVAASPMFRWSDDGRNLLYIDSRNGGCGLWNQSLDGKPPKLVIDPGEQRIWAFDQSRNGKEFILALGEESSDAVLINNFR